FAEAVSSILDIVDRYLDHRMNEAIKVAVQLQSDKLRDEAQAKNKDSLNKLDENIQKIIKEQVKEQVKKPKFRRSCRDVLGAVADEGAGAFCTCEMIGMDDGGRVGTDNIRGSTVVVTETSTRGVDSKRELIPVSGLGLSMFETN
nr:hypothetical protein [Tanacetum cinerariifolium]